MTKLTVSREIKFKIWDKKNRGWLPEELKVKDLQQVGPNFPLFGDSIAEVFIDRDGDLCAFEYSNDTGWGQLDLDNERFVIVHFTGLVDKLKKEIYEGDCLDIGTLAVVAANVKWDKDKARFMIHGHNRVSGKNFRFAADKWKHRVVVIGDIYSNPELLKGEKNV